MPHFSEMKDDKNLLLGEGYVLYPRPTATSMSPHDRTTIYDSKVQKMNWMMILKQIWKLLIKQNQVHIKNLA